MKCVFPGLRQKNYRENFAILRKRYPKVARWLQNSGNGKTTAVKLESGDFAFLLQENGERHWLSEPVSPRDKAKRTLEKCLSPIRTSEKHLGLAERGKPLFFIGMGAGYELIEFFNAQPGMFLSMKQPIYVVERSADILRLNFEIHDWKKILSSGRVFFFVGKKIDRQLRDFFRNALRPPSEFIFPLRVTQQRNPPFVARIKKTVRNIAENKKKEAERLLRETNRYYDSLSDKDWQRVFSSQRERPLRILLNTTRFSTFIQYCTRDVAQGFEALGHQTRTVIEKSDTERFSLLEVLRNLHSFQPDMIFGIDWLRASYGPLFHKNIPFVCWAQDWLPNLFNQQAAKRIGQRDVVLAVYNNYRQRLLNVGYTNEHLTYLPVPTNDKLYHPMKLSKKETEKYHCELSFVHHGSNPPEKDFADLLARFSDLRIEEILKIMFELVKERFYNGSDCYSEEDYESLLLEAEERKGSRIEDSKVRTEVLWYFYETIGNRFFRQLPLEWIVKEGYDLKLYGRGWKNHPRLSKYAQGPAKNGQELCKIYSSSQINLQLLHARNLHPRLLDGLASGGFFLLKYHPTDYEEGDLASYFDMNRDLIRFKGKDDLLRKVRFYLDHPEERRSITERARKKVLEKLTYSVSMQFVIDKVRERIERN